MKRVFKYRVPPMNITDEEVPAIEMHKGAKVVYVGCQNAEVQIWAEVPEGQVETERREIVFVGTGHFVPEGYEHVGSCLTPDGGTFVWHVYEKVA